MTCILLEIVVCQRRLDPQVENCGCRRAVVKTHDLNGLKAFVGTLAMDLRQVYYEFKTSLCYLIAPCLKQQIKQIKACVVSINRHNYSSWSVFPIPGKSPSNCKNLSSIMSNQRWQIKRLVRCLQWSWRVTMEGCSLGFLRMMVWDSVL